MKRIILLSFIGLVMAASSRAQGDVEVKIEQLIKLNVYLGWLEKGYQISQQGLGLINNLKHGDFSLHSDYFTALGIVKSPVLHDAKIAAAFQLQAAILHSIQSGSKWLSASPMLSPADTRYLRGVLQAETTELASLIAILASVITDGQLNQTDDERLSLINRTYEQVLTLYSFSQSFLAALQVQLLQRQKAAQEITTLQSLHK